MYGSITKNIWIIILLGIYSTVYGASTLPEPLHTLAHKSIDAVFREDFTKALNFAQDIIKTAPHRPAGYFFYAAVLNKQMEYEQSTRYENQFYKYCDKAIEVADKILDDRDDPWALFFKAGANGEKGTYESRYDKWITSFKHGWQAVQMLKDLVDAEKDFVDAYYGIATYNYWRTSKGKIMWWVPTGKDRRQAAVDTLYQMEKKGVYIRKNASLTLAYILVDYKKYRQALTVSQRFLQEYPHNLLGKWAELEALKGLKSYEELAKKGEDRKSVV